MNASAGKFQLNIMGRGIIGLIYLLEQSMETVISIQKLERKHKGTKGSRIFLACYVVMGKNYTRITASLSEA